MKPATSEAYKLLHDGALALSAIESNGIRIDVPYLEKTTKEVAEQIDKLEVKLKKDKVWRTWERKFQSKATLGSPDQLATILFRVMKFPSPGRTEKTGRHRADESALATVDHPFVRDYLSLRKLHKLRATYLEGIHREVQDGFLHPSFNLHTVSTYRSSSSNPNFQNIPIRDSVIGPMIRRAFVPRKKHSMIEIDFGSLEFNIAACFWKDPGMVAFASDPELDIHRHAASESFLCEEDQVHKLMRYSAKNKFVFPELYGDYYVQMAANLWHDIDLLKLSLKDGTPLHPWLKKHNITSYPAFERHIKAAEERFNAKFPSFGEGKKKWWNRYLKRGWFRLMTGFVIQGSYSRNFLMNAPIQGPGFHCLLWSIIELNRYLRKHKMKTKLIGQIHDCALADSPDDELQDFISIAKEIMTEKIREAWSWIIVPMKVEVDVVRDGETWHDKKQWIEKNGRWEPK